MKHLLLVFVAQLFCYGLFAEVSYTTAPDQISEKGRVQVTSGMRGKELIYRLTRVARGSSKEFDGYMEDFLMRGVLVLRVSRLAGNQGIETRKPGSSEVSLIYDHDQWKPDKILIRDGALADYYMLTQDGFYRAATDAQRDELIRKLDGLESEEKKPNQSPEPTAGLRPAAAHL